MDYVLAVLIGLSVGAASNVVLWRLPRGLPLARRPHCTRCGHALSWEALPLAGYLGQRGRCRYCRRPIPFFFPVVEVLTPTVLALLVWKHGVTWLTGLYALFSLALILTLFLDWLHRDIYYLILLPTTALALLGTLLPALGLNFLDHLAGLGVGLASFGFLFLLGHFLFRFEALSVGDVWLAGMIGAMTGFYGAIEALTLGIVLAALGAGVMLIVRRASPKDFMPYGPYLCLATLVYLCFGPV